MSKNRNDEVRDEQAEDKSVFEDSAVVKARRERLKREVGDASGDTVHKATDRQEIEGTKS